MAISTPFRKAPTRNKASTKVRNMDIETKSTSPASDLYDRWSAEPEMTALSLSIAYSKPLDSDKTLDDLMKLFDKRNVRRLVGRDYTVQEVGEHGLEETAIRSKIVGIHANVLRHLRRIEGARKQIKTIVSVEETGWLSQQGGTKSERDIIVDTLLVEADERIVELETLKEIITIFLTDIDRTARILEMVSNGMRMENVPERKFKGRG